ncbi:hypothetical protein ES705_44295 [subsurface metagenome]
MRILLRSTGSLQKRRKKNRSESDLIELKRIKSSGNKGIELTAAYFRSGMFKEAEEILDETLENNPDNSRALAYKGFI